MQLTRAADYAVRVVIHMAGLPPGTRVPRTTLAKATDVPESFMSKVLQALVRARLVASRRGVEGGFELVASPDRISLLDVVEAIEGPIQLNFCLMPGDPCERHASCPAHFVWAEAQAAMTAVLKRASLADLAAKAVLAVPQGLIDLAGLASGGTKPGSAAGYGGATQATGGGGAVKR